MDIAQIIAGALMIVAWPLIWMFAGALLSSPCLPCIWLSLARNTSLGRRWSQVGLACVLPGIVAAIDISIGALLAAHLVAVTLVLLTWRHVAYEKLRFSLAEMFAAMLVLAVVLALAAQHQHWKSIHSDLWFPLRVIVPVIAITPLPAILTWACAAWQRRWWVFVVFSVASFGYSRWLIFDQPLSGWDIAMLIAIQAGYALNMAAFVCLTVRGDLLIWPAPIDQADGSPDTLSDTLPSNHAVEGDSAGEM